MLENPKKFKNSPNLLLIFVKITKFLEFSKNYYKKTIVFSNSADSWDRRYNRTWLGGSLVQDPHPRLIWNDSEIVEFQENNPGTLFGTQFGDANGRKFMCHTLHPHFF